MSQLTGLAADLQQLRWQILSRHPEAVLGEPARQELARALSRELAQPEEVVTRYEGGRLRAAVVWTVTTEPTLGVTEARCSVDYDLAEPGAFEWTVHTLEARRSRLGAGRALVLDVAYEPLLPVMQRLGVNVQSLVLHGRPREALQSWSRHRGLDKRWPDPAALGLAVEPLRRAEQVEQIVALRRDYFRAHEQHSPIKPAEELDAALQAAIDEHVRQKLSAHLDEATPSHFVVLQQARLVGSFGLRISEQHPFFGPRCAGVEIALDPSVHGRGVGTLAYKRLLELMIERDVGIFKGITANPAVIHLARLMRRPLRGYKLVAGAPAGVAHLSGYDIR